MDRIYLRGTHFYSCFCYFCHMFLSLFIKGILIGLAVSVPMGPVGILIVQRTVNKDKTSGFLTGLGASLTDVFYALIAGFSLTYIIDFIRLHHLTFHILGAFIVFLLGIYIFKKNPVHDARKYRQKGCSYYQDLLSSFLITFPNPMVVFIFLAVFAGSGIVFQIDRPYQAFIHILGIFTGATIWWLTLTNLVSTFKHKLSFRFLWWFNKIAGTVIILLVLISFLFSFHKTGAF